MSHPSPFCCGWTQRWEYRKVDSSEVCSPRSSWPVNDFVLWKGSWDQMLPCGTAACLPLGSSRVAGWPKHEEENKMMACSLNPGRGYKTWRKVGQTEVEQIQHTYWVVVIHPWMHQPIGGKSQEDGRGGNHGVFVGVDAPNWPVHRGPHKVP